MNFNLKCDDFKNDLFNLINQSELPLAVVYYIYKDIFNQIQKAYVGTINSALIQKQNESLKNLKQIQNTNGIVKSQSEEKIIRKANNKENNDQDKDK